MIYNLELTSNKIVIYEKNKIILSTLISNTIFYCYCKIFDENDNMIVRYFYARFFCFVKIKIKKNNLPNEVTIDNTICDYKVRVDNDLYKTKFSLFPFRKKCCKILLNKKTIAIVDKLFWDFPPDKFIIKFNTDNKKIQYFGLISLLIGLTGYDDE